MTSSEFSPSDVLSGLTFPGCGLSVAVEPSHDSGIIIRDRSPIDFNITRRNSIFISLYFLFTVSHYRILREGRNSHSPGFVRPWSHLEFQFATIDYIRMAEPALA